MLISEALKLLLSVAVENEVSEGMSHVRGFEGWVI